MPGPNSETLASQASFIFKGTVQDLKATTVPRVPVTDRTAVVRVDEVLQAPEVLSHYKGQRITVQLGGDRPIKKGQRAVFYTNGWLFGESVAVQSIDHRDAAEGLEAVTAAAGGPHRAHAEREVRKRFEAARLVVSGRVTSIRVPPEERATGASLEAAAPPPAQPISEHDPVWRIAEVEVDRVHKGQHEGKTVQVRFPSSTDVRWAHAPKFHPGQEGFFMIHEAPGTAPGLAAVAGPGELMALHPADYQPYDQPSGIRALIGESAPSRRPQ